MSTVLSIVLSLFVIFVIRILLGLRKVARDVGLVLLILIDRLPALTRSSNLAGPFYIFDGDSTPSRLIARIARPIRYLNMGTTWTITRKYEGTGS